MGNLPIFEVYQRRNINPNYNRLRRKVDTIYKYQEKNKGNNTTDPTAIKKVREYSEQFYANKFKNSQKWTNSQNNLTKTNAKLSNKKTDNPV